MKLNLTYKKLAEIVDGELINDNSVEIFDSFSTNSKQIQGDCFWAIKGENFDANDFIPEAIQNGAKLIISDKDVSDKNVSVIKVSDTLKALQKLAKYHRDNHDIKVVAITGSNGKSTTKQILLEILKQQNQTCANQGNFNNQIGLPLSLLEINNSHKFGVFELGAAKLGDICEIAELTKPDIAIITNISPAHIGRFENLENTYKTKTEIIKHIKPDGWLIYNADDKILERIPQDYKIKSKTFGFSDNADLKILNTKNTFDFEYENKKYSIDIQLHSHDKLNASAGCLTGFLMGLSFEQIEKGVKNFEPMPMRLESIKKQNTEILLDCYNANPDSMKNALDILSKKQNGIKIAVLGDMNELGNHSEKYHKELAKQIIDKKIDYIFLAGKDIKYTYDELKRLNKNAVYSEDYRRWTPQLKEIVSSKSICLIKASRSLHFEKILNLI